MQTHTHNPQPSIPNIEYRISDLQRCALVVHGGAYDIPTKSHEAHTTGCRCAAEVGWEVLSDGGAALEAVEAAVRMLEDDPTFDAGRGSFLNTAAEIELDAIIMDGRDLNFGAVAAVQRVCHPVTLARLVMTESKHTMLVGAGAVDHGGERVDGFVVDQDLHLDQLILGVADHLVVEIRIPVRSAANC